MVPKELPDAWYLADAADVCEKITDGTHDTPTPVDDGIPYITAIHVKNGTINFDECLYLPQTVHDDIYRRCNPEYGDLLIVNIGAGVGECGFVNVGYQFSLKNVALLKPNRNVLEPEFLLQQHMFNKDRIAYVVKTGGAQPFLSLKELKKLKISVPPLSEQRKIAQILSTWDKAIATTERLLANKEQQKKALMQRLLTGKQRFAGFEGEWQRLSLGEVFSKVANGITYDSKSTYGLPVTRIETISTGLIDYERVGWAPDNESTHKYRMRCGDILYSHINSLDHIGKVAIYKGEQELFHGMNLLLLRPNKEMVPEFIYYVLASSIGKRLAKTHAKSAVNQASISSTEVKAFEIDVPSFEEQQTIANVLRSVDSIIFKLKAKLDNLKQQKKALMQQLLTGKRRVKVDEAAA